MINWKDLFLPPINLWNAPKRQTMNCEQCGEQLTEFEEMVLKSLIEFEDFNEDKVTQICADCLIHGKDNMQ